MTRRVSRHGTTYTRGSHMTRGGFPRDCHGCGQPTRLDECWQETLQDGTRLSWHHTCRHRHNHHTRKGASA